MGAFRVHCWDPDYMMARITRGFRAGVRRRRKWLGLLAGLLALLLMDAALYPRLAAECDQVTVMAYDTAMALPRAYVWTVRQQAIRVTRAVARGNPECRVMIGVPTYGKGPPSHFPWSENIKMGLKGAREGLAHPDAAPRAFAGVAPFADYTTQPEEWATYRRLWLEKAR